MRKLIICATVASLTVLACFDDPPTGPGTEPYPEPTSPRDVLRNVEMSFNRYDVDRLKAMLATSFVFYFDPNDVGQSPPGKSYVIPESWSYTEFWSAVGNMLELAHSVSLTINKDGVGEPDPEARVYKAERVTIRILVMIDELNGFIAGEVGYCNFAFESYDGEGGKKLWRLTGWWDRTAGGGDAAA
ncbi:MAG: hypothetical protein JSU81_03855, partial [Candidatus Coatesbacteria bacterium]